MHILIVYLRSLLSAGQIAQELNLFWNHIKTAAFKPESYTTEGT